MAYYALLNENNVVVNVIFGCDECDEHDWEKIYEENTGLKCKRTSYNTSGGKHINGGEPFRMNYASIDWTYDEVRDAFIPPKDYPSWVLNEETCRWEPPIPFPSDMVLDYLDVGVTSNNYIWDEPSMSWQKTLDGLP